MYFDAHTHLNNEKLYPHWQQHALDFFNAGGVGLVNIGVNQDRNQKACEIAEQWLIHEQTDAGIIKATVGLHPGEVSRGNITSQEDIENNMQALLALYTSHKQHIVAIGECGIDSHYDRNDDIKNLQVDLFHRQCKLAQELQLPIIIHTRDNFSLTLEVLSTYPDLAVYAHCRGYGPNEVRALHKALPHLWIGFCGNICYPEEEGIRESLEEVMCVDSIKLLLETDAPFLHPQGRKKGLNTPSGVIDIYQFIAQHTHTQVEQLQDIVYKNNTSFYFPTA